MARRSIQEIDSTEFTLEEAIEQAAQSNLPAFVWGGVEYRPAFRDGHLTDIYMDRIMRTSDAGRGAVTDSPPSE